MDQKSKFIIVFSVVWMVLAAGLFAAVILKWLDKETFKIVFVVGFVIFSIITSAMTWGKKK